MQALEDYVSLVPSIVVAIHIGAFLACTPALQDSDGRLQLPSLLGADHHRGDGGVCKRAFFNVQ